MTSSQTIKITLTSAATLLKTEEAALEVQLLLQHVLNVNRAWLIAHEVDALQPNNYAAFEALLIRRLNGEPIAYILGYHEFYGLKLKVTADTLIPRPDTETLVEAALARTPATSLRAERGNLETGNVAEIASLRSQRLDSRLRGNDREMGAEFKILDLGSGTGAIALAIAKHRPQAQITALDASQAALDIAIENAENLKIPNVDFVLSDWFSALGQKNNPQKFDVIVSNPPYIEANDAHLSQGDLRFEPLSALASGQDGLDAIRHIIKAAPSHLNPYGWLMLEHGYNQASKVAALLKQAGFSDISHAKDLSGIERVTIGRLA